MKVSCLQAISVRSQSTASQPRCAYVIARLPQVQIDVLVPPWRRLYGPAAGEVRAFVHLGANRADGVDLDVVIFDLSLGPVLEAATCAVLDWRERRASSCRVSPVGDLSRG